MDSRLDRPEHPWSDPDGDGHNCLGCPPDSIWRCDEASHSPGPSATSIIARALHSEVCDPACTECGVDGQGWSTDDEILAAGVVAALYRNGYRLLHVGES